MFLGAKLWVFRRKLLPPFAISKKSSSFSKIITVNKTKGLHIQKTINLTLNTTTTSKFIQNILESWLHVEAFKVSAVHVWSKFINSGTQSFFIAFLLEIYREQIQLSMSSHLILNDLSMNFPSTLFPLYVIHPLGFSKKHNYKPLQYHTYATHPLRICL